jgi:hypothetical protein
MAYRRFVADYVCTQWRPLKRPPSPAPAASWRRSDREDCIGTLIKARDVDTSYIRTKSKTQVRRGMPGSLAFGHDPLRASRQATRQKQPLGSPASTLPRLTEAVILAHSMVVCARVVCVLVSAIPSRVRKFAHPSSFAPKRQPPMVFWVHFVYVAVQICGPFHVV